ncbi:hypothetical protein D3C71_1189730 [compost metagenome]
MLRRIIVPGIRRQADRVQAKQRSADQPRCRTDTVQHTRFSRTIVLGHWRWRDGVMFFGQRCGQGDQQGLQRGFGIWTLAADLNFFLFADGQSHEPDQAVTGCRFAGEMQLRFALEALCSLPDQCGGPRVQTAAMGDADVADLLFADKLHFRMSANAVAANDVQQRLADLHRFERDGPSLKVLAVGEDQQADQAFALLRDLVLVVAQQRLAVGNPCTFLHQHGKALALQFDRVESQVQQQFCAVVGAQGHGVAGARDVHHDTGARCVQGVVQGIDGDPVTHGAAGEHRIRDFGEREHRAAERGAEGQLFIVFVHGSVSLKTEFGSTRPL